MNVFLGTITVPSGILISDTNAADRKGSFGCGEDMFKGSTVVGLDFIETDFVLKIDSLTLNGELIIFIS